MVNNKFKIVIPSYNNEKWIEYNTASIIRQTYKNYDVLYINDKSTDKTLELIEDIKKKYNLDNWKILNNPKNMKRGYNINPNSNHMTEFMDSDDDILVFIDGDDWLVDDTVLEKLNNYYNMHGSWMTYGGMYTYPEGQYAHPQNSPYSDEVHANNQYRKDWWRASHLRTFKWSIYKQIKDKDLRYSKTNEYYFHAEDLATSFPCLELCPKHKIGVLDFPAYVFNQTQDNRKRGIEREEKAGTELETEIRNATPYETIHVDNFILPKLSGGLGNMMFQIAAAHGISSNTHHKVLSDFQHVGTKHGTPDSYMKNIFRNINRLEKQSTAELYQVPDFHHVDVKLNDVNTVLDGYFQSYKYFEHIKDSILELFSPTEEIKNYISEKYGNVEDYVSIHIRRGDYTKLSDFHHNLKYEYYENAIDYFSGHNFMIFSDDIEWCKNTFDFSPDSKFIEGEEDYVDLYIMSMCKHNIIANSTFSWWAAYLNKNNSKIVVYPDKWFGPKNNNLSTKDLYPNDWICLSEDVPKKCINLFDNACGHLAKPNGRYSSVHGKISKHIKFTRDNTDSHWTSVFTDENLYSNIKVKGKKVGWLMETREVYPQRYLDFEKYMNNFDFVMTHDPELLEKYPDKTVFVPFGGCWIKDNNFRRTNKHKNVSMIYSDKTFLEGHKIRHAVANNISGIDLFGRGTNRPVEIKEDSLVDYRFSIVIENSKCKNYFTEKLVDCLAVGTIPIYWGCPNISDFFNKEGIITFDSIDELKTILENIDFDAHYNSSINAIDENIELAKKYNITEDWMYENIYDRLF